MVRPTAAPLAPVVFVTGKGGVGKTTVAAGLAVAAVQAGQRAVFVEFSDGQSGARALRGVGREVKRVVIRPEKAVLRAAEPLFGSSLLARAALGNFAMKPFLAAAPAVRELSVLALVQRVVEDNAGARVVVDMPATGHSLAWLRVAAQGRDLIRRGPLYALCERLARELVQPGQASVVVVTLPEPLVLKETVELCRELAQRVGLPPSWLVVNRVPEPLPASAYDDALRLADGEGEVARAAGELAKRLQQQASVHRELEQALREAGGAAALEPIRLPRCAHDPSAEEVAGWLPLQEGAS